MAGTVVTGNVSTEEVLSDERVIDMDEKIRVLKPDGTQFSTMTDKASKKQAIREKVNWLEEEDFPRVAATSAGAAAGQAVINLVAGQGKLLQAQDLVRNMRTGEASRVASIATDAITMAANLVSAVNSGDSYLVIADAQPQGSDFPTARYLQRVLGYNYTQTTRTPWTFTGTQTAIELYGGREPAKEAVRAARVHKKKWEAIGFWGTRSFAASSAANGEPQGTAGGAYEFITTFKRDAAGPVTADFLDLLFLDVFQYGSTDKVLFASPVITLNLAKLNRSGMGAQWEPTPDNVHGVHVDAFISGAYGYRVPVVIKKEFGEFPYANKGFGGYGFLLDMEYIEQRPMRDRDTKLLTEQQPKGKDIYAAEYFKEGSWEFAHERAHAIIFGATP